MTARSVQQSGSSRGPSVPSPAILVVMGVSGSGKTTVGERIAARQGWNFQEGDDLHPRANVEKMHRGIPLDDADRLPWLKAIAAVIDRWCADGSSGVVACSALKRQYRAIIIGSRPEVSLVYLKGSQDLIGKRMAERHGHFMPANLLESQFATLEEPDPDERPIVAEVSAPPERIACTVLRVLAERQDSSSSAEDRGKE